MNEINKWYEIYFKKRPSLHDSSILELGKNIRKKKKLSKKEFVEIMSWKLGNQNYAAWFVKNSQEDIDICFTESFFEERFDENKTKERLNSLCGLPKWVGVPVASAFLAVIFPEEYGVIDRFTLLALSMHEYGLNQYIKKEMTTTKSDYLKYNQKIKILAKECKLTPKEVDNALMTKGFYLNNKNNPKIKNRISESFKD